jgi:hypothetical protein
MLVGWLTRYNWEIELRYPQMLQLYRQMCKHLNWAVRPWNPVAREVTRLTTGRKVYRWFRDRDGLLHRLRVYPPPPPIREASTAQMPKAAQAGSSDVNYSVQRKSAAGQVKR